MTGRTPTVGLSWTTQFVWLIVIANIQVSQKSNFGYDNYVKAVADNFLGLKKVAVKTIYSSHSVPHTSSYDILVDTFVPA